MSFLPSVYAFGGYTFPVGFVLTERDQDSRIDIVDIPMRDGSLAPAGVEGTKTLTLQGQVGGDGAVDSNGDYITTRDQLTAELNLMASYLRQGYQQLKAGDGDGRYIWAQKQKFSATYSPAQGGRIAQVQIQFIAQDPRWLASTTSSVGGATAFNGDAVSNGSAIVYPKCTWVGAHLGPLLKISPAGGAGYIEVALTGFQMAAGDTLVIDCDPRNRAKAVLLNGTPRLDLLGTAGCTNTNGDDAFFPYMAPGTNVVSIGGSTDPAGSTTTLTWQDAWSY